MLVYRLYKSTYIHDPLSAEGARRAGGRWNPKGYGILYTSATPELALLEIVAHLHPSYVPRFHLLVLEIPEPRRAVSFEELPTDWQEEQQYVPLQSHLLSWLKQPDTLAVSVPSAIVSRSRNYLLHTLYAGFTDEVTLVENEPFPVNARLIRGGE